MHKINGYDGLNSGFTSLEYGFIVIVIIFHASHEQFLPSHLMDLAALAKQAGFEGIHCSDHFHPWSKRQGNSGFSFAWLGAALQATGIPCGTICAPGQRYHPAIVAQAAATPEEMFPGKFWLELGSGEAINECITGQGWPLKADRNRRLEECAGILRRLFSGETVTHKGLVTVEEARLYTLPLQPPPLIGAALTAETARWAASWADGLITVNQPREKLQQLVTAYKDNGGHGKPMYLKVQLSYAASEDEALKEAHDQWRTNVLPGELASDLRSVSQFDAAAECIAPEQMKSMVHVSSDLQQHIQWLREYKAMGFTHLVLHNVNRRQEEFVEAFGRYVLPALR